MIKAVTSTTNQTTMNEEEKLFFKEHNVKAKDCAEVIINTICHELGHAMYLFKCNVMHLEIKVGYDLDEELLGRVRRRGFFYGNEHCQQVLYHDDEVKVKMAGYVMQGLIENKEFDDYRIEGGSDIDNLVTLAASYKEQAKAERELIKFLTPYRECILNYAEAKVAELLAKAEKEGKDSPYEVFGYIRISTEEALALFKWKRPINYNEGSTDRKKLRAIEERCDRIFMTYNDLPNNHVNINQ